MLEVQRRALAPLLVAVIDEGKRGTKQIKQDTVAKAMCSLAERIAHLNETLRSRVDEKIKAEATYLTDLFRFASKVFDLAKVEKGSDQQAKLSEAWSKFMIVHSAGPRFHCPEFAYPDLTSQPWATVITSAPYYHGKGCRHTYAEVLKRLVNEGDWLVFYIIDYGTFYLTSRNLAYPILQGEKDGTIQITHFSQDAEILTGPTVQDCLKTNPQFKNPVLYSSQEKKKDEKKS